MASWYRAMFRHDWSGATIGQRTLGDQLVLSVSNLARFFLCNLYMNLILWGNLMQMWETDGFPGNMI